MGLISSIYNQTPAHKVQGPKRRANKKIKKLMKQVEVEIPEGKEFKSEAHKRNYINWLKRAQLGALKAHQKRRYRKKYGHNPNQGDTYRQIVEEEKKRG